jgi:hypothetical protein
MRGKLVDKAINVFFKLIAAEEHKIDAVLANTTVLTKL